MSVFAVEGKSTPAKINKKIAVNAVFFIMVCFVRCLFVSASDAQEHAAGLAAFLAFGAFLVIHGGGAVIIRLGNGVYRANGYHRACMVLRTIFFSYDYHRFLSFIFIDLCFKV